MAGRYRVSGVLGRGGMGEVYRADDLKLHQPVALKFLTERMARDGASLARFHREAALARQVSHRHVCRVYDIGDHGGMPFLSMEYVAGEELSSLLKRVGRLPVEKATVISRQLCAGLAAIHATGVLHRDLKTSNVMIDQHGDARIMDFGIAALAGEGDASIGTPAWMAPEQLARQEVTERSDIYSLGLLLYETFTGRRPFGSGDRDASGDSPLPPSALVPEIDPAVERVILRCLEKEPRLRPASALLVANALPGGSPLAAALAAGETPSPQMVAAAGEEGVLRPLPAILLFAWTIAAIAVAIGLSGDSLHRLIPLGRSPGLLQADAAEIVGSAGYQTAPADRSFGFTVDDEVLGYIARSDGTMARWNRLRSGDWPAIQFWSRQSAAPLEPYSSWTVRQTDPPGIEAGMSQVRIDTAGRLLYFDAVPASVGGTAPVSWDAMFERAGLDIEAFRPVPPQRTPPHHADRRFAWAGVHPRTGARLRVEAASVQGLPVYFEVIGPWQRAKSPAVERSEAGPFFIVLLVLYFGAIGLAAVLAWKNLRRGRGDRRGAVRLMVFVFIGRLVFWIFAAHHIPTVGEVALVIAGLQAALYWAAFVGLLYVALEPFVRRRWPDALISWSRVLSGDWRSPLVGRDVLLGGAFGLAGVLAIHLFQVVPPLAGRPLLRPSVNSPLLYEYGLAGARGFLPLVMNQLAAAIVFPLILTTLLLFCTMVTKQKAVAAVVTWAILYGALGLYFGDGSAGSWVIGLVLPTLLMIVLLRYGLLALMSTFFFLPLRAFYPLTSELTAWYATNAQLQIVLLLAIALVAMRTAVGRSGFFNERFFD